jgi:hypothetical protein
MKFVMISKTSIGPLAQLGEAEEKNVRGTFFPRSARDRSRGQGLQAEQDCEALQTG